MARIGPTSPGSVSLRFPGSPGTVSTGTPAAASAPASSVMGRPQACASSIAARSAPSVAPCGVCAAATSSRSTGATTRPPRTRLSESTTGVTGTTARSPPSAISAETTAPTSSGVTAGRAASCTTTRVSSPCPAPVNPHRPLITLSARVDPPVTMRHRRSSGGSADPKRSSASAGTTTATCSRPGCARSTSSPQRHAGRPQKSVHSLSRPMRWLLPAATRMAETGGADGVIAGAQPASDRGWAKIIRPATVCSTRVTVIGRSWSRNR